MRLHGFKSAQGDRNDACDASSLISDFTLGSRVPQGAEQQTVVTKSCSYNKKKFFNPKYIISVWNNIRNVILLLR